jgi:endonuclease/exonuclease/phosphatase family metal-dependent hydrolase
MLRHVRRLTLACAAFASTGCATAYNYLEPEGPRFEARLGQVQDADPALRVVTFNIENGQKVQRAVAVLASHPQLRGADVLVLQEMTAGGVEAIARALSLNAIYFPVSRLEGHDRGNAVLSPWPIEAGWKVLLPHLARVVKSARAAVAARLRIDGRPIVVYSVHLGSPLGTSGAKRRAQAAAVLADADRHPDDAAIVAGDFNSHSVGEVFVRGGFLWPTKSVGKTVGLFSFDHIFSRGLSSGASQAGIAKEVRDVSDHRPVWAVLHPAGISLASGWREEENVRFAAWRRSRGHEDDHAGGGRRPGRGAPRGGPGDGPDAGRPRQAPPCRRAGGRDPEEDERAPGTHSALRARSRGELRRSPRQRAARPAHQRAPRGRRATGPLRRRRQR